MRGLIITVLLIILISNIIILNCNCKLQLAKSSDLLTYSSIDQAKENRAFVCEYKPQAPFISIEGNKYYINEAWVAHPYYRKDFYDKIVWDAYFFSMSFNTDTVSTKIFRRNKYLDRYDFIQGIQSNSRILFYLPEYSKNQDTIIVHYRESLKSPTKNKKFLLFRK